MTQQRVFPFQTLLTFVLSFILITKIYAGGGPSKSAIESITATDARKHIILLASDKLKGRNSPSDGLTEAGNYIIDHFKSIGLEPVNGKYYHSFYLNKMNLGPIEKNTLSIVFKEKQQRIFEIKKDFVPFIESGNGSVSGDAVFVGYGIRDAEKKYDDYADVDVKNKIVVFLNGEPIFDTLRSVMLRRQSPSARFAVKIQNAIEAGAVGALVINDFYHGRPLSPRGTFWPQLNRNIPNAPSPTLLPGKYDNKIPLVNIGEDVAAAFFGSLDNLKSLLKNIDSLHTPQSKHLQNPVQLETTILSEPTELRNIVGLLSGSDPKLKDEIIVIGGHYDHVGSKEVPAGQDGIYNGADDNASGTTGVMEVAKAFLMNDERPRRSVLFMLFVAEEKGLLGSRAYVANPLFPIKNHAAMFNMDMIGRNNPDSLSIGGQSRCPELSKINEEENKMIGFTLAYNIESYFFRSDQASFAQEKIPVIFYFTGEHEDYHKVTDHADKINFDKLVRVSKLCFLTSWRVANLDTRLPYTDISR